MKNIREIVRRYARRTASPLALKVLDLEKAGDFDALLELKVSPYFHTNPTRYFEEAQLLAFFNKRVDLPVKVDPKAACLGKWWDAEKACKRTNWRIRAAYGEFGPPPLSLFAVREFIDDVRETITKWLGPAPKLRELEPKFGPGTTTSRTVTTCTVADKISSLPDVTFELALQIEDWFHETGWGMHLARNCYGVSPYRPHLMNIVDAARYTSVYKKATTDRPIEVQADLNVAYQLAVGARIKQILRRLGVNLRKEVPPLHRRLAWHASISGSLATDDLSSASDTIAKHLVWKGFPPDWVELFDSLRHKRVLIDGKPILLEKYSGMGNGYTFELESVLFAAICYNVLKRAGIRPKVGVNLSVFGDDIIIDARAQRRTVRVLSLLGFIVNTDKSFGPEVGFKESCGEDYFGGRWVRPHFLKDEPYEPQEWISFANGIRRVGINHYGADIWQSTALYGVWLDAIENIPQAIRQCRVPPEYGDLGINSDDTAEYTTKARSGWIYLRVWKPVIKRATVRAGGSYVGWDEFPVSTRLATSLYNLTHKNGGGTLDIGSLLRDPVSGYKLGWVVYGASPIG